MGFAATALPLAATVLGGLFSAQGNIQQGNAQSMASGYAAQVASNNAAISEQNAVLATAVGEANVQSQKRRTSAAVSETRATQASRGLEVNSGSNAEVQRSEQELGDLDALTIRNTYARTAYGYRTQGANYDAQAELDKAASKNAKLAGYLNATGSLLSSGTSVSSKWSSFQQKGVGSDYNPIFL